MTVERDYEIVEGDWPAGLADRVAPFGVTLKALQARNEGVPFKPGKIWVVPFPENPDTTFEWYEYEFSERPQLLSLIAARGEGAKTPFYPKNRHGAMFLWNHWYNRLFRAWQMKRGGKPDNLFTKDARGEACPSLWLPYKRPLVLAPQAQSPDAPPAADPGQTKISAPASVIDEAIIDLAILYQDLRRLSDKLYAAIQMRAVAVRDAEQLRSDARGLAGLTTMLYEHTFRVEGICPDPELIRKLKDASIGFVQALEKAMPRARPLEKLAPDIDARPADIAGVLLTKCSDRQSIQVVTRFLDVVPESQPKQEILAHLRDVLAYALDAIQATEAADRAVQMAEMASSLKAKSSVIDILHSAYIMAAQLKTATIGELPGPDSLTVALTKLHVVAEVWDKVNKEFPIDDLLAKIKKSLVQALRPDDKKRAVLEGAVDEMALQIRKGNDAAAQAARQQADEVLVFSFEKAQTHPGMNLFIELLNLVQLVAALASTEDLSDAKISEYASMGSLALQTFSGGMVTIGSVAKHPLITQGLVPKLFPPGAPRPSFRFTARGAVLKARLAWVRREAVINAGANSLAKAVPVLTLVSGIDMFMEGIATKDETTVTIAGLTIAAGLMLLVPGLQPAGAILSFIALALTIGKSLVEGSRPMTENVCQMLVSRIGRLSVAATGRLVIDELGVRAEYEKMEKANKDARRVPAEGNPSVFFVFKHGPKTSASEWAPTKADLLDKLKRLGFEDPPNPKPEQRIVGTMVPD